jgi:hypothetical protein
MSHSRISISSVLVLILIASSYTIGCKKDKDIKEKQRKIIKEIIIPPPNAIFSALQSGGKIEWKKVIDYSNGTNYTSIEKMALNLGSRVADGFVAIMAEDNNNMTAMGKSIKTLAKSLGIGDKVIQQAGDIIIDDKLGTWKKNVAKFNEIYSNIKMELEKREDFEVSYFCNLGSWLEALYIASKSLNMKYDAKMAENLRQKALVNMFMEGYEVLNEKSKSKDIVKLIKEKLMEIGKIIDFPQGGSLSKENAKKLLDVSSQLKKEIEKV